MRSRTPLPQRQQAHWGAFLEAAALFLALCVLGRSAALTLAAVMAAPFPAVQTALWWGQRNLQSETSDPEPEPAAEEQAPPASSAVPEAVQALTGGIEDYLVALQPEDARPADAGAVIEKQYPQGSGEKYIACGAGSIKNNTRQTAADLAAEIENPLPFATPPRTTACRPGCGSPPATGPAAPTAASTCARWAGWWPTPSTRRASTPCTTRL